MVLGMGIGMIKWGCFFGHLEGMYDYVISLFRD